MILRESRRMYPLSTRHEVEILSFISYFVPTSGLTSLGTFHGEVMAFCSEEQPPVLMTESPEVWAAGKQLKKPRYRSKAALCRPLTCEDPE